MDFSQLKVLIKQPTSFFEWLLRNNDIRYDFKLIVLATLMLAPLYLLLFYLSGQLWLEAGVLTSLLIIYIVFVIFIIIALLIYSLALFLILKLFKAEITHNKTLQLQIYTFLPYLAIGWIPIISYVGIIYYLFLLFAGIKTITKLTTLKTILVMLTQLLFFVVLFAVLSLL